MEGSKKRSRSESTESTVESPFGSAMDWAINDTDVDSADLQSAIGDARTRRNTETAKMFSADGVLKKLMQLIMEDKDLFPELLKHADFPTQRRMKRISRTWKRILDRPILSNTALLDTDSLFSPKDDSFLFKTLLHDSRIFGSAVRHVICDFCNHSETHAYSELASVQMLLQKRRKVTRFTAVRLNMDGSCWRTVSGLPRTLEWVELRHCRSFERSFIEVNGEYRRFYVTIQTFILNDFNCCHDGRKRIFMKAFERVLWRYPVEQLHWIAACLPLLSGQYREDALANLEISDPIEDENSFSGVDVNAVNFQALTGEQLYHLAMCIVSQRRPVLPPAPCPLPHFNIELPEDTEEPSDVASETSGSDEISLSDEDLDNEESDLSTSDGDLLACHDTVDYDARDAGEVMRIAMGSF